MKDKKFPYGKVEIGGKDIPLKKDGTPNKINLTKEMKKVYDEVIAEQRGIVTNKAKEELIKHLQKGFKK